MSAFDIPTVGLIAQKTKDPFQVPISCLLSLRRRRPKTANLVVTVAYGLPGICVTHAHRISNRIGYIQPGHLKRPNRY